ncbi:hypothetical protein ACTAQJ_10610 [Arthrobacter sp. alpha11c]
MASRSEESAGGRSATTETSAEIEFLESLPDGWIVPGADSPYWDPDLDPREEYIGSHLMEENPDILFDVLRSDEKLSQAGERAARLGEEYDAQIRRGNNASS